MKQFMVTLQSEVAGDTQKEQFVINAKNLNEALGRLQQEQNKNTI